MKIVVQRVGKARVDVIDEAQGQVDPTSIGQSIGPGLLLLVGVSPTDGAEEVDYLAHKIVNMRIFPDERGKTNRSVLDIGGQVLSISQFTLLANIRHGNRPSFTQAGPPEHAQAIWEEFNLALAASGLEVKTGRFGAHMRVELVNDGPFTINLDSTELMGSK